MVPPLRLFSCVAGVVLIEANEALSLLQTAVRAKREPTVVQAAWAEILDHGGDAHETALLGQERHVVPLADASPDTPPNVKEGHRIQVVPSKPLEYQQTRIAVQMQGDALEVFSHPEPSRLDIHVEGSPRGFGLQWKGKHCEIEHVLPGSFADRAGLKPGDWLQIIGGQTVATFDDVMRLLPRTGALDVTVARLDAKTILRGDIKNKPVLPRGQRVPAVEKVKVRNDKLTIVNNALASVPEILEAEAQPRHAQMAEALQSAKVGDIEIDVSGNIRGFSIRWENEHAIVDGLDHDGPAEKAGLVIGDMLMSINGEPIKVVDDVARLIPREDEFKVHVSRKPHEPVSLTETSLHRGEGLQDHQVGTLDILVSGEPRGFTVNWVAELGAVVDKVLAGSPAHRSGVRSGDVVLAVDEFMIHSFEDLPRLVPSKGEFELWVRRGLSWQ